MVSNPTSSSSPSLQLTLDFGEVNHRKRRRNRTRVSCLNCYAAKRKCDRKRPCTRCIKHGLTGLCVYEVDDPNARHRGNVDEHARLRYRIAELESLIREMNNRPHPRWLAPGGISHNPALRPPQHVSVRPHRNRAAVHAQNQPRSSSIDAFFAAIAEPEGQDIKVKVEKDGFGPEFTPSASGSPSHSSYPEIEGSGSPLTPLSLASPVSVDAPYTNSSASTPSPASPSVGTFEFGEEAYADASEDHSLLSRLMQYKESPHPSESSEDGPPLASIFQCHGSVASESPHVLLPHENFSRGPVAYASVGMQTSSSPEPAPLPSEASHEHTAGVKHEPLSCPGTGVHSDCRCLVNAAVYRPLLFFANSLRTSREALEELHPPAGEGTPSCVLFRRILELDEYIFSASPASLPSAQSDIQLGASTSSEPAIYPVHGRGPVLTPSSPLAMPLDLPVRHAHSYSLPFYSMPEHSHAPVLSDSDPGHFMHEQVAPYSESFSYLPDAADFSQLPISGWRWPGGAS